MITALGAFAAGLVVLVWSADHFVSGAASMAHRYGLSPLLIGMVVVGFGTSAPEMVVSSIAAVQGNPGIALGNAYGSNITNIALILGLTAVIRPVVVQSQVLRRELPILMLATVLTAGLICDGRISRLDAMVLLGVFAALMTWTLHQGGRRRPDPLGFQMAGAMRAAPQSPERSLTRLFLGLVLLIASSRALVWGAVALARRLGVDDLIIGLSIVAVGTSLPELASSIIAARKGQDEIALGNILGSNLFNTLAVVGLAGVIRPLEVREAVLFRDIPVMALLTVTLFVLCAGFRGPGRINRWEGTALLLAYGAYTAWLVLSATG